MPIFCSSLPVNIQLKSQVFSILWNLVFRYSSIFLLWWKGFLHRLTHLDDCVFAHLCHVAQCFMEHPCSWFLWGLCSFHQTRAAVTCARSPMPRTLLRTMCAWKVPIHFSSCLLSQPYNELRDLGMNNISYPTSAILSHSVKAPLSADQEVLQGTSWNISEQLFLYYNSLHLEKFKVKWHLKANKRLSICINVNLYTAPTFDHFNPVSSYL